MTAVFFPAIVGVAACLSLILSYLLVKVLIARSHASGLIDRPNERSSHTVPTPRGGGVAFVTIFLVAATILGWIGSFSPREESDFSFFWWLVPSSAAIAVLGFLDDRFSLRASRRLAVQSLATIISLVVLFWELPSDSLFIYESTLSMTGVLLALFAFLWVVWLTNLYNFMDGIDGYAALEAVLAAAVLAGITVTRGLPMPASLYLVFAAAVFGFLILNWAPAKIFMGDAGSTFLGFFFAIFAVALDLHHEIPLETTIIVLGTFIIDATYTLVVRVLRGKKAHVAHRDHAYQHAVQSGWSHKKTVLVFSSITLLWLTPLAVFVSTTSRGQWGLRLAMVAVAFLPLVLLQVHFRAGIEGPTPKKATP